MSEIDLKDYQIRTDLITETIPNNKSIEEIIEKNGLKISTINIDSKNAKKINKKEGLYITISFEDVTDTKAYNLLLEELTNQVKKIINKTVSKLSEILVVGLGNDKVTPDSLGPKVIDNIITTRHIYTLTGSLEKGYKIISKISPGVMGTTGIETMDIITSIASKIKPDLIIVIDSLAASKIERLMKTIQITNTGISPGSGIGNNRNELSKETIKIPVIAIGVPFVCDAVTICYDTMNYMLKHFSYNINNKELKNKLIPINMQNYLNKETKSLSQNQINYLLGAFGGLSSEEKRTLISEVLTPIGYNLMVTTKEVDFIISKISKVISTSINNALHN